MTIFLPAYFGVPSVVGGGPGTTNLVAWWSLDETSGTRADSHGSNDLTDNNTVLYGTGVQGNAGDFELSTSEYLSIADNTDLSTGNIDFTICAWVKAESLGANAAIISKQDTGTPDREYLIGYANGSSRFYITVSSDGSATTIEEADNLGAPSTGTWYFIVAWHDAVNDTLNIQVNNGTVDSQAYASGVHDSAADFNIGANNEGGNLYWDGLIDEVAFFKAVLTSEERTWLYNGGNGRVYSDLT